MNFSHFNPTFIKKTLYISTRYILRHDPILDVVENLGEDSLLALLRGGALGIDSISGKLIFDLIRGKLGEVNNGLFGILMIFRSFRRFLAAERRYLLLLTFLFFYLFADLLYLMHPD